MRVYKCLFSGDEFISDSYPISYDNENACMKVRGAFVKKGSDQIAIASDDVIDDDENAETVNNIVDAFQLNEIQWSKKDFMAWAKPFMKKTLEKLKEDGKDDRIDGFKKGATELVKAIAGEWDEYQVFTGKAYDMEGSIAFCKSVEHPEGSGDYVPMFFMFADALKEEKF